MTALLSPPAPAPARSRSAPEPAAGPPPRAHRRSPSGPARRPRRSPAVVVLDALGALGAGRVLALAALLGGLCLAALGPVLDQPFATRTGAAVTGLAAAALLALQVPRTIRRRRVRRSSPVAPAPRAGGREPAHDHRDRDR